MRRKIMQILQYNQIKNDTVFYMVVKLANEVFQIHVRHLQSGDVVSGCFEGCVLVVVAGCGHVHLSIGCIKLQPVTIVTGYKLISFS